MTNNKIDSNINNKEPFLLQDQSYAIIMEYFRQNMPNYSLHNYTTSKMGYMELSYKNNSNITISIQYGRAYLEWCVMCEKNIIDTFSMDGSLYEIKYFTMSNLTYLLSFLKNNF